MNNRMNLVLGTMTFGPQVQQEEATQMIKRFLELGHVEIDTAYVYNEGASERFIGKSLENNDLKGYKLATKVNPRITGSLDAISINDQFYESLRRMSVDAVDTLYLHFPDPGTPLEVTLGACAELHQQGKFKELGLSNFPAWLVVDIWHICKNNGWPVPTVYQGVYNGLSRRVEDELFSALKKMGIRFYAYNPLAGGILAGKYKDYNDTPTPGRFTHRPNYKDRYWRESFFQAVDHIVSLCNNGNVKLVEAAYRWLAFHSEMDPHNGDGILMGASSLKQLEENLQIVNKGPLPQDIVAAFDQAWQETKADSPNYFRYAMKT